MTHLDKLILQLQESIYPTLDPIQIDTVRAALLEYAAAAMHDSRVAEEVFMLIKESK